MEPINQPAHVLYVDDDLSFAEMIATMLEREAENLIVQTANSAAAGLEIVRTEDIDCVVSDYSMPNTNGLEFLQSIRGSDPDLPFLLLTGRGSEDIASEAISAGVTDYLQKQQGTEHYSLLANRIMNAIEQYWAEQELERKKRELKRVKDRFQSFVKHSPDIITAIDKNGTIQYMSPAIEHVLGYGQEELTGEKAIEYVHPADKDRVSSTLSKAFRGDEEGRVTQEYRIKHADGSWAWVESITSAGKKYHEGGYIINSRDVTDRKQRERELEQKSERLEQFARIVSHDLQTPITIADARLDMAMDECDSEHLPRIGNALDRMEEIIDATLALAREGRVVDETRPVDIRELAEHCFQTVTSPRTTLRVTTDKTIKADQERLRHVLENLFANAVDHGGEDVMVHIGEIEPDGFYIEDDGPGIPDGKHEEIFEAGFSLAPDGNGFGLAIVKEIVDAHGWQIEATESETGGARFEITNVRCV